MPKAVEDCVKKINGTNPKTNKPYTQSEKWAICTASHNKKKEGASEIEEISIQVANATYNYATKLYQNGRASSMVDAYEMAQITLDKYNHNYEILELIAGE